jgi:curved DNA-binding protein
VEIELSLEDAFTGGRRRITLPGPDGPRSYEVDVPAGVTPGQRIRLAGQGAQGSGGAGDLYLVVSLAPHARFRLDGRNITVDLPVTPWEAALGARVPVDTPGGEAKVTVPAGSSSGRRLRLRGKGLPNPKGTAGDLYAEVKVMVPRKLSDRERELFEELGRDSDFDPRKRR